jgi:hypothetical protein
VPFGLKPAAVPAAAPRALDVSIPVMEYTFQNLLQKVNSFQQEDGAFMREEGA